MSCPQCGCSVVEAVNIPGQQGDPGADGANGKNAYTTLAAIFPIAGPGGQITVVDTSWMAVGMIVYITDGTLQINALVSSIPDSTHAFLLFQFYPTDSVAGNLPIGAQVITGGRLPLVGSLPGAITDNTGGTISSTLTAQVGVYTLPFFVNLPNISAAATSIINAYVVGHAFKVMAVNFISEKAVTTAAKAVTLTPAITGVAVTGGVLALTSANCTPTGHIVAASTITGLNTGSATDTLTLTSSANTVFIEGTGWIVFRIQNMEAANAAASLASKINSLIAAL
jgi:hypothetical protein